MRKEGKRTEGEEKTSFTSFISVCVVCVCVCCYPPLLSFLPLLSLLCVCVVCACVRVLLSILHPSPSSVLVPQCSGVCVFLSVHPRCGCVVCVLCACVCSSPSFLSFLPLPFHPWCVCVCVACVCVCVPRLPSSHTLHTEERRRRMDRNIHTHHYIEEQVQKKE